MKTKAKTQQQRQLESYAMAWALDALLGMTITDVQIDERGDVVAQITDERDTGEPQRSVEVRIAPPYMPYLDRNDGGKS